MVAPAVVFALSEAEISRTTNLSSITPRSTRNNWQTISLGYELPEMKFVPNSNMDISHRTGIWKTRDAPVIFPERDRLESLAPNGAKFPYGLNQNNEDNVHGEILICNADELYSEMPL
jgi:hypothetical protein